MDSSVSHPLVATLLAQCASPVQSARRGRLAGVLAVIVAAGAFYAIAASGSPAKKVAVVPTTTTATTPTVTTTAATTTTPPPVKPRRINNFTVAFYGNHRTRTRDFAEAGDLNPPFKLAWEFGGNALLEFPATIWGNNLYLIDDGATVKRVNITTGKQIWLQACRPALSLDAVARRQAQGAVRLGPVELLRHDRLHRRRGSGALDAQRQDPVDVPGVQRHRVLTDDRRQLRLLRRSGRHAVLAEHQDGHENWSFETGRLDQGRPRLLRTATSTSATYGGSFYAVSAKSGREVWAASPGGAVLLDTGGGLRAGLCGQQERRRVCVRSRHRRALTGARASAVTYMADPQSRT